MAPVVSPQFSKSKIKEPIKIAIEAGIYHFDCASIYKTEEYVGESIRTKIADGTLRREDIFYTSKVLFTEWICNIILMMTIIIA